MNSEPLSACTPCRSNGSRSRMSASAGLGAAFAFAHDGGVLGPAGGHVGDGEGVAEHAVGVAAFVADGVDLAKPGDRVGPLGPGLERDRRLQHATRVWSTTCLGGWQLARGRRPTCGRSWPATSPAAARRRRRPWRSSPCRRSAGSNAGNAACSRLLVGPSRHGPAPPQRLDHHRRRRSASPVAGPPRRRRRPPRDDRLPDRLAGVVTMPPVVAHTASRICAFSARVAFAHFAACAAVICRRTAIVNSIHARSARGQIEMSQRTDLGGHLGGIRRFWELILCGP